jgi:hypothetical protein
MRKLGNCVSYWIGSLAVARHRMEYTGINSGVMHWERLQRSYPRSGYILVAVGQPIWRIVRNPRFARCTSFGCRRYHAIARNIKGNVVVHEGIARNIKGNVIGREGIIHNIKGSALANATAALPSPEGEGRGGSGVFRRATFDIAYNTFMCNRTALPPSPFGEGLGVRCNVVQTPNPPDWLTPGYQYISASRIGRP